MRARYYDPTTAQFITRDPIESQTRAAYAYVNGNPLNMTDPSGLFGMRGFVPDFSSTWIEKLTDPVKRIDDVVKGVAETDLGSFDYGTAIASGFNMTYGPYKVLTGLVAVTTASALLPFSTLLGVPGVLTDSAAIALGTYQVVTGSMRAARGGQQFLELAKHPYCATSPADQTVGANVGRFVRGVGPNWARGTISFIGGLPS